MLGRFLIAVLLAASSREKVPRSDEWKCLASGGRLRVQLDAFGDTAILKGVPNDGGNDSEIDLGFERAGSASLFARQGLGVHVTGHRVTGPIRLQRAQALRQAKQLFATLAAQPQKKDVRVVEETLPDGTVRGTVSSTSGCASTSGLLARISLSCGKARTRSWSLETFACNPSEDPAGRAHDWADGIFDKHRDSPIVRDAPGERLHLRR
jgi:hypothetical protein